MIARLTRLFGLLALVVCALVPADLRARMVEACAEPDECCCRRAERLAHDAEPTVRRVDCCEAPCEVETTSQAAVVPPGPDVAPPASGTLLPLATLAMIDPPARTVRGRAGPDPPQRLHALFAHWLV